MHAVLSFPPYLCGAKHINADERPEERRSEATGRMTDLTSYSVHRRECTCPHLNSTSCSSNHPSHGIKIVGPNVSISI